MNEEQLRQHPHFQELYDIIFERMSKAMYEEFEKRQFRPIDPRKVSDISEIID